MLEAVGKLEPGVYVMMARPDGHGPSDPTRTTTTAATQWFVVSDLGLTAFSGDDGVHVLRALAGQRRRRSPSVEIRLVARNNEILATKQTDADGHVAFDPGLARGKGGLAPGRRRGVGRARATTASSISARRPSTSPTAA